MFGDVDKKLMKYFKKKEESPFALLMKIMKKENGKETQKALNKKKDKDKDQ